MRIEVPPQTGDWLLEIGLLADREYLHSTRVLPIQIEKETKESTLAWNMRLAAFDYQQDHISAIQMAMERVHQIGVTCPRILEIGGNASPMIRDFEGQLVNIDVDVPGMQMGLLANRHHGGSITFLVGNANTLPFPEATFDSILVFSSLHHFPDPRASLRHFARILKPGGVIGVLCEPIGHYYGAEIEPSLLGELQKGINEQTFSLEEWAAIFRASGLREDSVTIDRGSLKAFLIPA